VIARALRSDLSDPGNAGRLRSLTLIDNRQQLRLNAGQRLLQIRDLVVDLSESGLVCSLRTFFLEDGLCREGARHRRHRRANGGAETLANRGEGAEDFIGPNIGPNRPRRSKRWRRSTTTDWTTSVEW
jgi:hypothetical protein